jgi:predicted MFS family arabinose efflux permease
MPRVLDPTTRLILVLGLGAGASSLAGRALDPLVGVIGAEFSVAAATVALLGTAFALPYAIVQPVLGPVGDAIGKERVIRACLVVLALALAACAAAPDLGTLAELRVDSGGAAGGVFPLAIAIIGDRVPLERRQVALSRLLVAGLTGSVAGGALAAAVAPLIGWRGVMVVCAVAALAGLFVLRNGERAPAARRLDLGETMRRYAAIFALPAARSLYIAVFIEGALIYGIFPFLAPLFEERGLAGLGGGVAEAGLAVAFYALGGFVFAALAPMLLGRMGQARMMVLGGVLSALGLTTLAFAPAAWIAITSCLVLGLGFYMIHSSIQTRVTEVAPKARGTAVALHAFSFFFGQSLGPVVIGLGWATMGPAPALLCSAIGILLLAAWLAPRGRAAHPSHR